MRIIIAILFAAVLAACAQIGGTAQVDPKTPNERLVVLEFSYQAALNTVDALVTSGTIRGDTAAQTAELVKQAGASVRAARAAIKLGGADTTQVLTFANSLLAELIKFLNEQQEGQQTSWLTYYSHYKPFPSSLAPLLRRAQPWLSYRQLLTGQGPRTEMSVMKRLLQLQARQTS